MTHSREFHAPCKSGDNAELSVTFTTYDDDDGGPDDYISFKTSRGKSVWLRMKDARELAGWLIEHAVEPVPEPEPMSPMTRYLTGGAGGAGGVAYGGAGGMAAYGGQGGAGGSATIVQRVRLM